MQRSAVKHCQKLPVGGWPGVLIVPSQSVYCTAAHWQGSNGGWPAEEAPTDRWHGERSTGNHIGETHVSCVWTSIRLNGVWKRFTKRAIYQVVLTDGQGSKLTRLHWQMWLIYLQTHRKKIQGRVMTLACGDQSWEKGRNVEIFHLHWERD